MVQGAVFLEAGAGVDVWQPPPPSSHLVVMMLRTRVKYTPEARAVLREEIKDMKMGVHERENAALPDDSSGSEKPKADGRIRRKRELADAKGTLRERDDAPPSDESSGREKSKKDR